MSNFLEDIINLDNNNINGPNAPTITTFTSNDSGNIVINDSSFSEAQKINPLYCYVTMGYPNDQNYSNNLNLITTYNELSNYSTGDILNLRSKFSYLGSISDDVALNCTPFSTLTGFIASKDFVSIYNDFSNNDASFSVAISNHMKKPRDRSVTSFLMHH